MPPYPPLRGWLLWEVRLIVGVTVFTHGDSVKICFASSALHSATVLSFHAGSVSDWPNEPTAASRASIGSETCHAYFIQMRTPRPSLTLPAKHIRPSTESIWASASALLALSGGGAGFSLRTIFELPARNWFLGKTDC